MVGSEQPDTAASLRIFYCIQQCYTDLSTENGQIYVIPLYLEKLKSHISPGIDQIPAELFKEGGKKIRYQIIVPLKGWKSSNIWDQR